MGMEGAPTNVGDSKEKKFEEEPKRAIDSPEKREEWAKRVQEADPEALKPIDDWNDFYNNLIDDHTIGSVRKLEMQDEYRSAHREELENAHRAFNEISERIRKELDIPTFDEIKAYEAFINEKYGEAIQENRERNKQNRLAEIAKKAEEAGMTTEEYIAHRRAEDTQEKLNN